MVTSKDTVDYSYLNSGKSALFDLYFEGDNTAKIDYPVFGEENTSYTIKENILVLGTAEYTIEKLSRNSLILSQPIMLNKFYYIFEKE